jgi:anti-anti-sigma factor
MGYIPTVYAETTVYPEDFIRVVEGDIVIIKVNLPRATFKEAEIFRDKILYDILRNNLKVIVDLSICEYIDSTFLGALVIGLKKISERGGEIKYVIPKPEALYLLKLTGLYGVFNLYRTSEDAVDSFNYPSIESLQ